MKRSEMIEYIHNWYWNNYPKFRAKDLLDMLEKEGMLPPQRLPTRKEYPELTDAEFVEFCKGYMGVINKWEPEDE